ncbi:hypothetical protein DLH88_03700 [Vibrio parahaemolyticus]|nr:hypothetical protein [Vibrio parahaemolyticus]EGR1569816.1 hypothetical protein [Vibrio parahaemolyticus]EGR2755877.1 hypothetical protein [Vibrio parahaemolyticus]EGR2911962.1 hypothetical protein [Vibrio parahaemolyticus]EGR3150950.1 hypothetical protein [Vibrio parahaemolyticus]
MKGELKISDVKKWEEIMSRKIFGGLTKNSVKWQQVKKQNLKIRRIGGVVSGAKFCLGVRL